MEGENIPLRPFGFRQLKYRVMLRVSKRLGYTGGHQHERESQFRRCRSNASLFDNIKFHERESSFSRFASC